MVCIRCGRDPCNQVDKLPIGYFIHADIRNSKGRGVGYFMMCTKCLDDIEIVFKHTIGRVVSDDHINIWRWGPMKEFEPASEKIWLLREEWKAFVEELHGTE